jgi:hypothetical protein
MTEQPSFAIARYKSVGTLRPLEDARRRVSKKRASRRAVSAEMERLAPMISVSRLTGMRKESASELALMPASSRIVFNTWPGWIGCSLLVFVAIGIFFLSVIIRSFNFEGVAVAPFKTNSKLVVHANAVLSSAIANEFSRRRPGIARSLGDVAALRRPGLIRVAFSMLFNFLLGSLLRSFFVSLPLQDRIIAPT